MAGPIFDPHDPYNALVSGDLGSFLDDFASKHGAKKLQNQPQFMENLGFSSEVSMADLLAADTGRFMPTASNLGVDNSEESPQFPLNTFYDAGQYLAIQEVQISRVKTNAFIILGVAFRNDA
ncbi:hypothetical protein J4E85_000616 [Alternaria conjuncta]|uniref:uncharacterized protein n=1 Tax=Alternaria conjuncta TaxID=181017 RepID=UPI0022206F51|nr:uncharacterized protein J4E85_000616 [Alternaria conjuncta]KAI4938177.1 hypothetical protein J4E85_000616 [Alternaria conjuncta]